MQLLLVLVRLLSAANSTLLAIGRQIGIVMMFVMVVVILIQVFFRYVLNNALPWPDEAARFLMLWMTGLVAPSAYRWGGFVSIDMLVDMLPKRATAVVILLLLILSGAVLFVGLQLGYTHVNSGWLFNSASLKLPLDWFGGETVRIKLAWMYMSMLVGVALLLLVNVELILRCVARVIGREDELPPIPHASAISAE